MCHVGRPSRRESSNLPAGAAQDLAFDPHFFVELLRLAPNSESGIERTTGFAGTQAEMPAWPTVGIRSFRSHPVTAVAHRRYVFIAAIGPREPDREPQSGAGADGIL